MRGQASLSHHSRTLGSKFLVSKGNIKVIQNPLSMQWYVWQGCCLGTFPSQNLLINLLHLEFALQKIPMFTLHGLYYRQLWFWDFWRILGSWAMLGQFFFFFSAAPFFINILDILLIKMETKCILIMYVFSFCQNITFWDVHHLCHLPAHQLVSINLSFFSLRALSRNEIINIYWHFYLLACLFSVSLSTI